MAITVQPTTFTKVAYEAEQIAVLAQRALEGVAELPDDLDVDLVVDEMAATNRCRVDSIDPVAVHIDGGALEYYRKPRSLGDAETLITCTRLFLEVADRQSTSFGAPDVGAEIPLAHRMAWDVNLFGRTARHGLRIHQPRYRYNFRNRHGFSDRADAVFDTLWAADEPTWAAIVAWSDEAAGGAAA